MATDNVIVRLSNRITLEKFKEVKEKLVERDQKRYSNDDFQKMLLDSFLKHELGENDSTKDVLNQHSEAIADLYNTLHELENVVEIVNNKADKLKTEVNLIKHPIVLTPISDYCDDGE